YLPRKPGQVGMWLALTGARLKAADCLVAGIATHYVDSSKLVELKQALNEPPSPRGAGAGGGGRSNAQAPDASARPPSVALTRDTSPARGEDARPRKLGHGWSPDPNVITRQKDRTRTKRRAKGLRRELTPSERKLRDLLRTIEGAHFPKEVAVDEEEWNA
ncbi:MAG: enoyl-CoA hydratase/isomerase family protein, partial [Proteobacteria bacterium]|nr:enoyl-CoA hydratase/isomerase family protein [Pseudomonadota bacterium]